MSGRSELTFSSIRGSEKRRRLIRFTQGVFIGSLTWPIMTAIAWAVVATLSDNPRRAWIRHRSHAPRGASRI